MVPSKLFEFAAVVFFVLSVFSTAYCAFYVYMYAFEAMHHIPLSEWEHHPPAFLASQTVCISGLWISATIAVVLLSMLIGSNIRNQHRRPGR